MAFARVKTWVVEKLKAAELNAEFDNIINILNTNIVKKPFATAAEITTGTEADKAIAPDQLALTRATAAEIIAGTTGKIVVPDQLALTRATAAEIIAGTTGKIVVPDQLALTRATAAEELAGAAATKLSTPSVSREMIINLKPTVNAAVNKLDLLTKSGNAIPDATNPIKVMIPDGNGYTQRTRAEAYLSGTSQIILADATDYWSKGSLDAEIKTAWLYAIWDGTGIVWALGGYSGFNSVSTTTTATDDDYFLLEASSTYTRSASHYCVAVAKIRYQYDTADTPDHTIQSNGENAPQVIWNARSDYGYSKALASPISAEADITSQAFVSLIVKQSGKFYWSGEVSFSPNASGVGKLEFKTGSATYASAALQRDTSIVTTNGTDNICASGELYLNAGDSIHLGGALTASGGTRKIRGTSDAIGCTMLTFRRVD